MRFSALLYFYGRRLRTHPVQEVLAGLGIAIGVALVFAVQVANSSITTGSSQIVHSIVGSANLQLRARSSAGFGESIISSVRALPGVEQVAPVLDLNATVKGPSGRAVGVQLVSASLTLASLDGLAHNIPLESLLPSAVMLPSATAHALGVSTTIGPEITTPSPIVSLRVRGRAIPVKVGFVLGTDTVGELSNAIAVIAPLRLVQRIAGLPGRVTRLLVRSQPDEQQAVRRGLEKLAGGRLDVTAATNEVALLRQATTPNGQATGFFAFVSALVGMLLAFNAMLLSAPERRRVIADLRIQGARPRSLVMLLLFQSLCLGFVASVVGIFAGDLLSRSIFHETPGYLSAAFPLGTQTVIGWQPVVFSLTGGVIATCLAAAPPLFDLRRSRAIDGVYFEDGEPGQAMAESVRIWLFVVAIGLVVVSNGALLILGPNVAVVAIVGLALAALLAIPFSFTLVVRATQMVAARTRRLNMLLVATRALRATTARSLALAATGAIAVFGSVAAEGAHRDLLNGLYGDYSQYVSTADLWVTNQGDELATNSFPVGALSAQIARVPGVVAVRPYQGGFLNIGNRRVWAIARASSAPTMFPTGQIVEGDPKLATALLRAGGWIAVSQQIAQAAHVRVGQRLTLPTPTGAVSYRVAATTTNLGWAAGAIVLNDADYRRAWATTDLSALEIDVGRDTSSLAVKRAVEGVIGKDSGLRVQTSFGRAAQADVLAREGLGRLTQISLLLVVAAALAMAAAMGASIWQRRRSLASLRIQSFSPLQLRAILLFESTLVLGTGCLIGAAAGVYGHELIDRYLRLVTGFPAPFSPATPQMLETTVAILAATLIVLSVPGYMASRVPPSLALQE
jgi:putative ABC transport system permease protein